MGGDGPPGSDEAQEEQYNGGGTVWASGLGEPPTAQRAKVTCLSYPPRAALRGTGPGGCWSFLGPRGACGFSSALDDLEELRRTSPAVGSTGDPGDPPQRPARKSEHLGSCQQGDMTKYQACHHPVVRHPASGEALVFTTGNRGERRNSAVLWGNDRGSFPRSPEGDGGVRFRPTAWAWAGVSLELFSSLS